MSTPRTVVIGGAVVDVVAVPDSRLAIHDSNPGRARVSFGGVGRNIAEAMARLGSHVHLVSVLGNDLLGRLCHQHCLECGIHMEYSVMTDRAGTGTYVAVLDENRDLHVAVSDLTILRELRGEQVSQSLNSLGPHDTCVIDTNLEEGDLQSIAQRCPCALALDPISAVKARRAMSILPFLTVLKPNLYECEALCGRAMRSPRDFYAALSWFHSRGVGEVLISLGEQGVAASDGQQAFCLRLPPAEVVNATGAGDSFLAAYLVARERRVPFEDRVMAALRVARRTLQVPQSVAPDLGPALLVPGERQDFERIPL
jgi:pseudouridine kinase